MTVDAGPDLQGPCVLEEVISCILRVRQGQVEGQQTRFVIGEKFSPSYYRIVYQLNSSHMQIISQNLI